MKVGRYFVKAHSVSSFQATNVSLVTNVSKDGYSVSATVETVAGKKKMKFVSDGFAYYMEYGVFSAVISNFGDTFEWQFGARFITEAEMRYDEEIGIVDLKGSSKKVVKYSFNVKDDTADASVDARGEYNTEVTTSTRPVVASWLVYPTLDGNTDEMEGLYANMRWVSQINPDDSVTTYLQPRLGTHLNWSLEVHAVGDSGGSIQVDNRGTTDKQSTKVYVTTF